MGEARVPGRPVDRHGRTGGRRARSVGILKVVGRRNTTDESPQRGAASFGARLRVLRQAAGLTQEELALRAGLSPNAVSALERGARRRPQPHTVRSLSEALGLPEEGRAALLAAVPDRVGPASSATESPPTSATPAVSALLRPANPLVGRERELEEVRGLLAQQGVRLLTLTGIGGVARPASLQKSHRKPPKTSPTERRLSGWPP